MPTENSSPRIEREGLQPLASGDAGRGNEVPTGAVRAKRHWTLWIAILAAAALYVLLAVWLRPEMAGPLSGLLSGVHDTISDRLQKHPDHPVDLNTASPAELQQLPGIGPVTAGEIIRFREQSGPILRPEDLLALPRFTRRTLERIRPYIIVNSGSPR